MLHVNSRDASFCEKSPNMREYFLFLASSEVFDKLLSETEMLKTIPGLTMVSFLLFITNSASRNSNPI